MVHGERGTGQAKGEVVEKRTALPSQLTFFIIPPHAGTGGDVESLVAAVYLAGWM